MGKHYFTDEQVSFKYKKISPSFLNDEKLYKIQLTDVL